MKKQMTNPFLELQDMADRKVYIFSSIFSKNRTDYLTRKFRKKAAKFCQKYKGFSKCRQCKGTGFLAYPFVAQGGAVIEIEFRKCNTCKLTGVESWIDKMTRGWKESV